MSAQFVMIESERLDRLERQIAGLTEALRSATVVPAPEWCSISDAARRMGVSPATIRRKIALGQIEAQGNGKTKRVRLV